MCSCKVQPSLKVLLTPQYFVLTAFPRREQMRCAHGRHAVCWLSVMACFSWADVVKMRQGVVPISLYSFSSCSLQVWHTVSSSLLTTQCREPYWLLCPLGCDSGEWSRNLPYHHLVRKSTSFLPLILCNPHAEQDWGLVEFLCLCIWDDCSSKKESPITHAILMHNGEISSASLSFGSSFMSL